MTFYPPNASFLVQNRPYSRFSSSIQAYIPQVDIRAQSWILKNKFESLFYQGFCQESIPKLTDTSLEITTRSVSHIICGTIGNVVEDLCQSARSRALNFGSYLSLIPYL
jgi:hypothetical protein